jgi:hypothetical protein
MSVAAQRHVNFAVRLNVMTLTMSARALNLQWAGVESDSL